MTRADAASESPFKLPTLEEGRYYLSVLLLLAYGELEKHPLGRGGSLLRCVCDFANESVEERLKRRKTPEHLLLSYPLPVLKQWQSELMELLHAAVESGPHLVNPSDKNLSEIHARLEAGVKWQRRFKRALNGVVLLHDAYIDGHDGLYALVAILLMHQEYRNRVQRCPICLKFFVKEGKRKYCTDECATAANDGEIAKRQRHRRLRLAAQELLPQGASRQKREDAVKQAFKNHRDVSTPELLAEHAKALLRAPRKHR